MPPQRRAPQPPVHPGTAEPILTDLSVSTESTQAELLSLQHRAADRDTTPRDVVVDPESWSIAHRIAKAAGSVSLKDLVDYGLTPVQADAVVERMQAKGRLTRTSEAHRVTSTVGLSRGRDGTVQNVVMPRFHYLATTDPDLAADAADPIPGIWPNGPVRKYNLTISDAHMPPYETYSETFAKRQAELDAEKAAAQAVVDAEKAAADKEQRLKQLYLSQERLDETRAAIAQDLQAYEASKIPQTHATVEDKIEADWQDEQAKQQVRLDAIHAKLDADFNGAIPEGLEALLLERLSNQNNRRNEDPIEAERRRVAATMRRLYLQDDEAINAIDGHIKTEVDAYNDTVMPMHGLSVKQRLERKFTIEEDRIAIRRRVIEEHLVRDLGDEIPEGLADGVYKLLEDRARKADRLKGKRQPRRPGSTT